MSVIGIDFGNQNCVIAQAKRGGIEIILNEASARKTPNLVSLQQEERFLGSSATSLIRSNCKNTVAYSKRVLGRQFSDPSLVIERNFIPVQSQLAEQADGAVGVNLRYGSESKTFSTEAIAAMLLSKLQQTAAKANPGRKGADVAISVPGFWTDVQRRALLSACEIAQVKCVGIINETTATALNYGIWKNLKGEFTEEKSYVLFVDMGESAYSVSLVAFQKGKLEVIASEYDRNLGGRDIDLMLAQRFGDEFQTKYKKSVWENPKAVIKLKAAAEKCKITLTPLGVPQAKCNVECLVGDYDLNTGIKIDEFEELCAPLLERIPLPIQKVLSRAGLSAAQLAAVEVVGGCSRVPCFRRKLADTLGLDQTKFNFGLSMTMNADESVAMGAALYCASLSPLMSVKPFDVVDCVHYPIRLTWDPAPSTGEADMEVDEATSGETLVLFNAGDGIPKIRRITFRRSDAFCITASYDEEAKEVQHISEKDRLIGRFNVAAVPVTGNETEAPKIRVNVKCNMNGTVSVSSAEYFLEKQPEPEELPALEAATAAPVAPAAPAEGDAAPDAPSEGEAKTEGDALEGAAKAEAAPEAAAGGEAKAEAAPEVKTEAKTEAKTEVVKKKFKRVNLSVVSEMLGGLGSAAVVDAVEAELKMAQQDRLIQETNDARNDLESFVYESRDALLPLADYVTEDEKNVFTTALDELENWLYDDGAYAAKKVYVEKLNEMRAMPARFEMRRDAEQQRPAACQQLSEKIEAYRTFANSSDEAYAHISDENRQKVRTECEAAEDWLNTERSKQGALRSNEDPVLMPKMVLDKLKALNSVCLPVMNTPKPKPVEPKAEEPSAGTKAEGDASPDAAATPEVPMTDAGVDAAPAAAPAKPTNMDLD